MTSFEEKFSQNEFLKKKGITFRGLLAVFGFGFGIFSSSSKKDTTPEPKDFTISLDNATYSIVGTVGNFVITKEETNVGKANNAFLAVTQIGRHEGVKKVAILTSTKDIHYAKRAATLSIQGKGTINNGNKGLNVYSTPLSGNALRILDLNFLTS